MKRPLALLLALGWLVPALLVAAPAGDALAGAVPTSRTNIDTIPSGAEVFLLEGDSERRIGVTPMKLYRLPRGVNRLKFKKDGYEDQIQTVEIVVRIDTFVFNLVRKIRPATLEFVGTSDSHGARILVNGRPEGTVPGTVQVPPGRHHCVVEKDGYERWERWIDATENQRATFDVTLKRLAAAAGQILVTSNPSGGEVRLNGAPRGTTPTVIEELAPGQYIVEVLVEGYAPSSQTVNVESGKRTVVDAQLASHRAASGQVRVLSNLDDTAITLNGEPIGTAPAFKADVPPGTHVVAARTPGGARASKQIEVRAGEVTTVSLELTEVERTPTRARVRVVSSVPGSTVDIDGQHQGPSPLVVEDLDPGTHFVTVTAPGYSPWRQSVDLKPGDNQVVAELGQSGQVEIQTRTGEQAEVFVDGRPIGRTPFVGSLPVGTHNVLLRRADGETEEFRVAVGGDRIVKITAAFGARDPHEVVAGTHPMSWSARAMPAGKGSLDFFGGWPYLLGFQAGGGIGSGIDLSVQARFAFNVMNEVEAIFQWTYASTPTVAASLEGSLGGGLGGEDRNTFFGRFQAKGSVMVGERAAISARLGLLLYTDRLGPEDVEIFEERDAGARFTLGFSVEVRVAENWNVFLIFDGDPLKGGRGLYEQKWMSDTKLYGSLGASWAF